MESEFRRCLAVNDGYASEGLRETLDTALTLLRKILEAPFVVVGLVTGTSDRSVGAVVVCVLQCVCLLQGETRGFDRWKQPASSARLHRRS